MKFIYNRERSRDIKAHDENWGENGNFDDIDVETIKILGIPVKRKTFNYKVTLPEEGKKKAGFK